MCATVVSRVDASPVLDVPEHVFNAVALLVESSVMGDGDFSVGF